MDKGGLIIDRNGWEVRLNGRIIGLSSREFRLLAYMAGKLNRVVTRHTLIHQTFSSEFTGSERLVDVTISRLRRFLLKEPACPVTIKAVPGAGYKMVLKPAASESDMPRMAFVIDPVPVGMPTTVSERESQLVLRREKLSVLLGSQTIALSPREFRLLECLMGRINRVIDRAAILDEVCGEDVDVRDRAVDTMVSRLRRRLFDLPACPLTIRAISGVGYKLVAKADDDLVISREGHYATSLT